MTILSTTAFAGPYAPNGVTTSFPFSFTALQASDIRVVRRFPTNVPDEILGGYTAILNAGGGGSVNFTVAPAAGNPLYVLLSPSFEQQFNFANQGNWSPTTMNAALDTAAERDIYLLSSVSRAVLAPPGETMNLLPAEAIRASAYLSFDNLGNPQVGVSNSEMNTIVAAVEDFHRALLVPNPESGATLPAASSRANKVLAFDNAGQPTVTAFSAVYGGPQIFIADSRVIMAAMTGVSVGTSVFLAEDGRAGIFKAYSTSFFTAQIAADTRQGIYVQSTADPTIVFIRQFDSAIELKWFGTVNDWNGSTGTDNLAIFDCALAVARARSKNIPGDGAAWYLSEPIRIGLGEFYMSAAWSLILGIKAFIDFTGSQFHFPANCEGIIINADTTDGEADRASGIFPKDLILLNPRIQGGGGTNLNKPGFWMRRACTIINGEARNFAGDGCRIGDIPGFSHTNTNGWFLQNFTASNCGGNGIKTAGSDANAGVSLNHNISLCGRFGVDESSAIGNKFVGQVADCGIVLPGVNTIPAFTYFEGHNWAIVVGQEENTDVEPSASRPDVWIDMGAAAGGDPAVPAYVSGMTMLAGGAYCSVNCAGTPQFDHIYTESGYGISQFSTATMVRDPTGSIIARGGCFETVFQGQIENYSGYRIYTSSGIYTGNSVPGPRSYVQLGGWSVGGVDAFGQWGASTGENWTWTFDGSYLRMAQGNGKQPFAINYSTGRHSSLDVDINYKVGGVQVVGAQQPLPASPTGGTVVDTQARGAIDAIRGVLAAHGLAV